MITCAHQRFKKKNNSKTCGLLFWVPVLFNLHVREQNTSRAEILPSSQPEDLAPLHAGATDPANEKTKPQEDKICLESQASMFLSQLYYLKATFRKPCFHVPLTAVLPEGYLYKATH